MLRDNELWRGKPKVRGQVKHINEGCKLPPALARLSVTYHPRRTINEGPFSRRLEAHRYLEWAERQTHETARPSSLPHKRSPTRYTNSPSTASFWS